MFLDLKSLHNCNNRRTILFCFAKFYKFLTACLVVKISLITLCFNAQPQRATFVQLKFVHRNIEIRGLVDKEWDKTEIEVKQIIKK